MQFVIHPKNLPVGVFDLEWSFEGYKTVKEVGVRLSAGKELRRRGVMEQGSSGIVIIRDGSLGMGMIANVDIDGIDDTDTFLKLETTAPSPMNFFASNTPNGSATGAVINVLPGMPVEMKFRVLKTQLGITAVNRFLNVQNVGAMPMAGWKVTFTL
jgi:hypothetical protein